MAKKDQNAFVTNKTLDEAVEAILKGMDNMVKEMKKIFAIKEELREEISKLATKEDLKREVFWLRDDINGLKGELATHRHSENLTN